MLLALSPVVTEPWVRPSPNAYGYQLSVQCVDSRVEPSSVVAVKVNRSSPLLYLVAT